MAPPNKTDPQIADEVINVTLSRSDYETLRDIIDRQKSLSWLGKWAKNVLFVAAGGILALIAFGDQLKQIISGWIGTGS